MPNGSPRSQADDAGAPRPAKRAGGSGRGAARSIAPRPAKRGEGWGRGAGAGDPLRFRAGDVSDARAVAAVMQAAIRVLARGSYPARVLALWSSLPPLYHAWAMSAGGEDYLLADRGGRVEGYAALHGREVTAVFVRPAAARRGVGRALLARVERLARRRGERSVVVRAARGAVPFYEASGYARGGRTWVPLPEGAHLDAVVLRKTLSAAAPRRRPR